MNMAEKLIGHISHWYGAIGVAGVHLDEGDLHANDTVHILGHTTDITQQVGSMQIDHNDVTEAHAGDDIGIKVGDHVREHDKVFLVQ